jgi:hypothetical protein
MTDIEKRAVKGGGSSIEPIAVRLPEATRISGFSRSDLYRRAARGEIVFLKSGTTTLVDFVSLRAAVMSLPKAPIRVAVRRPEAAPGFQGATGFKSPPRPRVRLCRNRSHVKEEP